MCKGVKEKYSVYYMAQQKGGVDIPLPYFSPDLAKTYYGQHGGTTPLPFRYYSPQAGGDDETPRYRRGGLTTISRKQRPQSISPRGRRTGLNRARTPPRKRIKSPQGGERRRGLYRQTKVTNAKKRNTSQQFGGDPLESLRKVKQTAGAIQDNFGKLKKYACVLPTFEDLVILQLEHYAKGDLEEFLELRLTAKELGGIHGWRYMNIPELEKAIKIRNKSIENISPDVIQMVNHMTQHMQQQEEQKQQQQQQQQQQQEQVDAPMPQPQIGVMPEGNSPPPNFGTPMGGVVR